MSRKCKYCGNDFNGISRNYCSWGCAEVGGLPQKLERVLQNDIGHTEKLSKL